jgi:hypothetical protein
MGQARRRRRPGGDSLGGRGIRPQGACPRRGASAPGSTGPAATATRETGCTGRSFGTTRSATSTLASSTSSERQDVPAAGADLASKPHEKVHVALTDPHFRLAESEDVLYNAAGNVVRARGPGTFEHEVGSELDLTVAYKLDYHTSFLFGWPHPWPGSFIQRSGPSEDVDSSYIQYAFNF